MNNGVTLFVGGHAGTIQGERETFAGNRMFTASYPPQLAAFDVDKINGYIDSGAFSDSPKDRLSFEDALKRQLDFEIKATEKWARYGNITKPWRSQALVSYDLLIDEVWNGGQKHKRRWSISQADWAVTETIAAAQYLTSQRVGLYPRRLILSCQGVDAWQYQACTQEILKIAQPDDIIGLGGWCILGRFKSWIPEFWRTIYLVLPMIAANGNRDIHIFGVLYQPVLGGLLWLADKYGLSVSTDSSAPVKSAACKSPERLKKAGCRAPGYLNNVKWWIDTLANLRQSPYYRQPPELKPQRQLSIFEF